MDPILEEMAPEALVAAVEDNLTAYLASYAGVPGAQIYWDLDIMWVLTGIAEPFFNAVLRTRLPREHLAGRIEAVLAVFQARGVPMLWWVTPSTQPPELGSALEAQGLTYRGEGSAMAADLSALPENAPTPEGFAVEEVRDVVTLLEWIRTNEAAYGARPAPADVAYVRAESSLGFEPEPSYRRYLGRLNGEPVATSALFLGAGVAGLYAVATVPWARRRGIGAAISLAPLRAARDLGYRVAVLESSALGAGVYRTLGFRECCRLRSYIWTPPAPAPGVPPRPTGERDNG
jgi:GNAT superfamily N-acetyltransferase